MSNGLNQGQQDAADYFFTMLFHDDVREMAISGGAGVGKTFLMGHLINTIMPQYSESCKLVGAKPKYTSVMMTATTNKAAEVLGLNTGRPTSTVHSFFNLAIYENFRTGEVELRKTKRWKVHHNMIIFIDEAYFMDSQLRKYILEGTANCKIIYVGDADQMAPVKEKICPVADPINAIPTVYLTEPMRNAGQPALVALCNQLKANVTTRTFDDIQLHKGSIEYLTDEEAELMIQSTFDHQNQDSRILCFHNRRVTDFNDYIRSLRGTPAEYQEGEYLINNSAIRTGDAQFSVETVVLLKTIEPEITMHIDDDEEFPIQCNPIWLTSTLVPDGALLYMPKDRTYLAQLKKYFKREKMWSHFFFINNTFPDLRPRDACTVYKAQGSTLESVFIDLTDISSNGVADTVARLLYVAASRATDKVYFFGELAPKFGRLVQ